MQQPSGVTITYDIVFSNGDTCRKSIDLECVIPSCCEQVKVEPVLDANGKATCCAKITATCQVKAITVTVTNGTLGSVNWNCTTPIPTGYAGLATYTFAPGSCLPEMTTCVNATAPGVVITYDIIFSNGDKCQKIVNLDCEVSGCITPPSGMTAWWPLDETDVSKTGSISNDLAGFNNVGVRTNGPVPVPAMVLGGLQFDGIDDYVEVPDNSELNFGEGSFSIDAWIQTTQSTGQLTIVNKIQFPLNHGYSLFLKNGEVILILAASSPVFYASSVFVANGLWNHIAVTIDRTVSNGINFYLNGSWISSKNPIPNPGTINALSPLRIGSLSFTVGDLFKGTLDEIELFNRVLTQEDVYSIYSAGSAGKCKPDCCEKVKVEPVLDSSGKPTCCAKITATCEVKAITVTVTNGTLGSVNWNCTTPIPTGYAGLATYTFAPGSCLPEMTTCVNATASGVVITYDIEFSNGEKCRKSVDLECIPPSCCDQVKAERVLDADGKATCCGKITSICKVKEITVTVTNGTLSSVGWNCSAIIPPDCIGQPTYTFAADDCVPTMSTCVDAKVSGVVTITYDIVFSNGEKCQKTVYLDCIATPASCCELVKVERFSTNTESKSECCARISSTCKVKEVDVVIENGTISSTSWTCGTLPSGYVGQSNFTFAPNGCVIDMTNCIRPIKSGLVVVYYTIYFENGEKCEKKVELDCSLASGCVTPPSDMKAWWPLDETDVSKTGSISNDLAGFNNVGTRTNGPVPIPAKVLGGLQFDGVDDYVEVPDQSELNFGTGDLSFDAWILTTDASGPEDLVDKRIYISGYYGYSFFINDGCLSLELANGTLTNYVSSVFVADGKWHHIAVTVSRANPRGILFYIDGVPTQYGDPTTHIGSLDVKGPLRIGSQSFEKGYLFKGILDEIELFNRVLTKDEIVSIFNAGSAGKCKPTGLLGSICGTKFNDLNGNGKRDDGEPGILGWTIQLGGTAEKSVMTDKNGDYCFTDLEPGDYKVAEEIRKGWFQMLPASQGVYEVNLSTGQKIDGVDFGNRQPIILVSPDNGVWIPKGVLPEFTWDPPITESLPPSYKIKIVKILGGQSPDQAMLMNAPWYENTDIRATSFTYPGTALRLEPYQLYGWLVDYFLGEQPINGLNQVSSEVRTFTIQGPAEVAKVSVSLQQPLPYQLISEDLWNGTLTNLGETTLKVLLTGTLEKTGTGKIVESTSGVLSLFPGKTAFFNTDFNTDLVNSIFDRWGLKSGNGDYTACVQVKNESGEELASACIVQRVETPTSTSEFKIQQPYNLEQNYPNPFNSTSTIGYSIPKTSFVNISVYDIYGKEIKVLVNEVKDPGHHEVVFDRQDFVSGIYFYTLKTVGFTQSKKMIIMSH